MFFLLSYNRLVRTPQNQGVVLLVGEAQVGHWHGHNDQWPVLLPDVEEGVTAKLILNYVQIRNPWLLYFTGTPMVDNEIRVETVPYVRTS